MNHYSRRCFNSYSAYANEKPYAEDGHSHRESERLSRNASRYLNRSSTERFLERLHDYLNHRRFENNVHEGIIKAELEKFRKAIEQEESQYAPNRLYVDLSTPYANNLERMKNDMTSKQKMEFETLKLRKKILQEKYNKSRN